MHQIKFLEVLSVYEICNLNYDSNHHGCFDDGMSINQ